MTSDELKTKGNAAFVAGRFAEALEHFTAAIEAAKGDDAALAVLWSNRSAAHASMHAYGDALADAERSIALRPNWAKAHGRKAAALVGMHRVAEAAEAYRLGLSHEPENAQLAAGLRSVEEHMASDCCPHAEDSGPLAHNPFADPDAIAVLRADPRTAMHMSDPSFLRILDDLRANPNSLLTHIKDQRVVSCFSVLLGARGFGNTTPASPPAAESQPANQDARNSDATPSAEPAAKPAENAECEKHKDAGNKAYKERRFDDAIAHYDAALAADPSCVAALTNKAAVFYETARYDECIATCEEAVRVGREAYADFRLIARALARMGSAYERKDDLPAAIEAYRRSMTEHRTPEVLSKLNAAERLQTQRAKEAYRDPVLAEEERTRGNDAFKAGDFAAAVKHYTEAIARNDADARLYTNRATAYAKLAAVPEGLRDCERALALDPTSVKAYIRRAMLLLLRRDTAGALEALASAKQHDKDGSQASEIDVQTQRCYAEIARVAQADAGLDDETRIRRAVERDPEVGQILGDPAVRQILQQMQTEPGAVAAHMANPAVAAKIRKLMAAGIIRVGP